MFITNRKTIPWKLIYKERAGGITKSKTLSPGQEINIPEIPSTAKGAEQIIVDPYLRKVRAINDASPKSRKALYASMLTEGLEFRATAGLTGTTL